MRLSAVALKDRPVKLNEGVFSAYLTDMSGSKPLRGP